MSGRQPGAPSHAEAARMRANAQTGATSITRKYQWQMPRDGQGSYTQEFPIVPVAHDPYDDVANIKSSYALAEEGKTNWVVPFEQADAAYMMRKRDDQEKAQFDAWVMQKYDIKDPAQNLMLQNIAPELFQRREEVIDANQQLVSAYAKMRLRGAKSLADLELEWLIETGRVELPAGPIWQPSRWRQAQSGATTDAEDQAWNAGRYTFGLFSPMQWLTESNAGRQAKPQNRADIRGNAQPFYAPGLPYPGDFFKNYWGQAMPYPYANTHDNEVYRESAEEQGVRGRFFANGSIPASAPRP